MRLWTFDAAPRPAAATDEALLGVLGSVGAPAFAAQALASLNAALVVGSWSIYRVHPQREPLLHASAAHGRPDLTAACFRAYAAGLHRQDRTVREVRDQALEGGPLMTHWRAEEMPPPHREGIYERHGMRERVSLLRAGADGSLLCVNLYRHERQPRFRDQDFEAVHAAGRWLLGCVERHLALAAAPPPPPVLPEGLTPREQAVCERLLAGLTLDGIAADLGLALPTIKTYRNRAFLRLGIQHRNQLYALALGSARHPRG